MKTKRRHQINILGIGNCFIPHYDKEILLIHQLPDKCISCKRYWSLIKADG